MILQIEIFLFVLCALFLGKFVGQFVVQITRDNPEPIKVNTLNKILIYLSSSYVITALITIILHLI